MRKTNCNAKPASDAAATLPLSGSNHTAVLLLLLLFAYAIGSCKLRLQAGSNCIQASEVAREEVVAHLRVAVEGRDAKVGAG